MLLPSSYSSPVVSACDNCSGSADEGSRTISWS